MHAPLKYEARSAESERFFCLEPPGSPRPQAKVVLVGLLDFITPPFINMKHICNCFLSFCVCFYLENTENGIFDIRMHHNYISSISLNRNGLTF